MDVFEQPVLALLLIFAEALFQIWASLWKLIILN